MARRVREPGRPIRWRGAAFLAALALTVPGGGHARRGAGRTPPAAPNAVITWNVHAQTAIYEVARQSPTAAARSFAMVQGAVYDAVNAIAGTPYEPYLVAPRTRPGDSTPAAVATAAYRVLLSLFPAQADALRAQYDESLAAIPDGRAEARRHRRRRGHGRGHDRGPSRRRRVLRRDLAGRHRAGRVAADAARLRPGRRLVRHPEAVRRSATPASTARPGPPALTSAAYARDLNEVKALGSATSTIRTPDQTEAAIWWDDPRLVEWEIKRGLAADPPARHPADGPHVRDGRRGRRRLVDRLLPGEEALELLAPGDGDPARRHRRQPGHRRRPGLDAAAGHRAVAGVPVGARLLHRPRPSTPCGSSSVATTSRSAPTAPTPARPAATTASPTPWPSCSRPGSGPGCYTGGSANLWAPDISYRNGRYYLYYSASTFGSQRSAIFLATSPTGASGSWTNRGLVIESSAAVNYNAIDPNLVVDAAGQWWLSFGSFWTGIKMIRLDPATGLRSTSDTTVRAMAQRTADGGAIEAPFIFKPRRLTTTCSSRSTCAAGRREHLPHHGRPLHRVTGPVRRPQRHRDDLRRRHPDPGRPRRHPRPRPPGRARRHRRRRAVLPLLRRQRRLARLFIEPKSAPS